MSPANIPIYQFKTVIIAAGILLVLQGIAQVFRCVITMRTGVWPTPDDDVEETGEAVLQREGIDGAQAWLGSRRRRHARRDKR